MAATRLALSIHSDRQEKVSWRTPAASLTATTELLSIYCILEFRGSVHVFGFSQEFFLLVFFFIGLPPTRYPLTSTDCVRCFPSVDFSCVWANWGVFLSVRGWNWLHHFWKRFGCVGATILLWDQLPSFAQCFDEEFWRFCVRSFGCRFALTDTAKLCTCWLKQIWQWSDEF